MSQEEREPADELPVEGSAPVDRPVAEGSPVAGEPATEGLPGAAAEAPGEEAEGEAPSGERRAARETREGDRREPGERRRRHFGRRKVCAFCVEKVKAIDYKDSARLRRYLSDRGRIDARRKTGTCAKHQRWLAVALKRARHLALLPYTPEHIRASGMFASRR